MKTSFLIIALSLIQSFSVAHASGTMVSSRLIKATKVKPLNVDVSFNNGNLYRVEQATSWCRGTILLATSGDMKLKLGNGWGYNKNEVACAEFYYAAKALKTSVPVAFERELQLWEHAEEGDVWTTQLCKISTQITLPTGETMQFGTHDSAKNCKE